MSQQLQVKEKEINKNANRAEKSLPAPRWRNLQEFLEYVENQAQMRAKSILRSSKEVES